MSTAAIPSLPDLTTYLLHQTACRASYLMGTGGFTSDNWGDLRQEMLLDCLQRLPRFNPDRGDVHGFVRGVVRNRSFQLVSRQARELAYQEPTPDAEPAGDAQDLDWMACQMAMEPHSDPTTRFNLGIDVEQVLQKLPEPLRILADQLAWMSITEICHVSGRPRSTVNHMMGRIRRAFEEAGITPAGIAARGGTR
ncbi:MAG: hypothetical protein HY820_04540 [Acidobacteria bacterium]|nr:hypothetical protein [Acidobacteriota bacterium]